MSSPPSSRTKNDSSLSASFRPPTFCLKRFATNHLYPLIRFLFSNFLFLMLHQRVNTPFSTILVFFCLFANWPLLPRPRLNILLNLSLRWLNTVFDTYASFTFVSKTLDPLVAKNGTLDEKADLHQFAQCKFDAKIYLQWNPDFSNLQGKRKFVREIGSSRNRRWHQITLNWPGIV